MMNKRTETARRNQAGWKRIGTKAYEQLMCPRSSVTLRFRSLTEGDLTCPLTEVGDLCELARFDIDEDLLPHIVLAGEISGTIIDASSWEQCIELEIGHVDDGDPVVLSIPRELIDAARPYDNKMFVRLSDSLVVCRHSRDTLDTLIVAGVHVPRTYVEGLLAYITRKRGWYFYGPAVKKLFVGQELTKHALAMYEEFKRHHWDWCVEFSDDCKLLRKKMACAEWEDYNASWSTLKLGYKFDMEVRIGCQTFIGDEIDDAIDALARFLGWMS